MARTISLKGDCVLKEREADAAITPGDLVEIMTTGNLRRHATLGGAAQRAFALENDLIGKGIDDDYAAGETCRYGVYQPGAEVFVADARGTVFRADARPTGFRQSPRATTFRESRR